MLSEYADVSPLILCARESSKLKRGVLFWIVREMLAVLHAESRTTGDEQWQVLRRVLALPPAVDAGATDDQRVVQHGTASSRVNFRIDFMKIS